MFREREEVERQILVYWKARRSGPRLWKTSTIQDGTQKIFDGGEEGERRRRLTSLPAEALCSGRVNCKRNICQRGCFELLGRKKKVFFPFSEMFLYIFMQREQKNETDRLMKCNFAAGKNKVSSRRGEIFILMLRFGGKVRQQVEDKSDCLAWSTSLRAFGSKTKNKTQWMFKYLCWNSIEMGSISVTGS